VANLDWKSVYREERRRPGYVLENGRSVARRVEAPPGKPGSREPVPGKRKAA